MFILVRSEKTEDLFNLYLVLKKYSRVRFEVINVETIKDYDTGENVKAVLLFFPDATGNLKLSSFKRSDVDVTATGDIILGDQVMTPTKIIDT